LAYGFEIGQGTRELMMKGLGGLWRTWWHGRKFVKCGKRCHFSGTFLEIDGHVELGDYCKLRNNIIMRTQSGGKIIIGTYSGLSYCCFLEARKMVKIGNFTGVAEFTVMRDTNHCVIGTAEHWRQTPYITEPIVIGDAVLITSGCYIGPGVAVGDGAVIAPHSYVVRDVGPYEVWAGNPARKIAHRTKGVPDAMQKQYIELVEKFGVKKVPGKFEETLAVAIEAAESGRNRAAEERDRLKKELADRSPNGGETD
jgi:acetyltransferase-like isoleucine patch superfamily enzyme